MSISFETRKKIEEGLKNWDNPDSEFLRRFEELQEYYNKLFYPLEKAIEESERLTERLYD